MQEKKVQKNNLGLIKLAFLTGFSKYLEKRAAEGISTALLPHQEEAMQRALTTPHGVILSHALGSGKTLSSLAIANALGKPTDVVVPASLLPNYLKEIQTHTTSESVPFNLYSLQDITRFPEKMPTDAENKTLVVDEAHRLRSFASKAHKLLSELPYQKKVLLTGTPIYNSPADIASLISLLEPKTEEDRLTQKDIGSYVGQQLSDYINNRSFPTAAQLHWGKRKFGDKLWRQNITPETWKDIVLRLPSSNAIKHVFPNYEELKQRYVENLPAEVPNYPHNRDAVLDLATFMLREKNKKKLLEEHQKKYEEVRNILKSKIDKYVHKYTPEQDTKYYPSKDYETIPVEMTKEQSKAYVDYYKQLPEEYKSKLLAKNIEKLPPGAQQNPFLVYTRMISNLHNGQSPKADKMVQDIKTNEGKTLVYSHFLDKGLHEVGKRLDAEGIPYAYFTGKEKNREQIVKDYNSGKIKVLLLSSAGGEGLDLKNTAQVQIMEPHWNESKINQVIGRAARYQSHSELPEEQRKVKVRYYVATVPDKKVASIDDYMYRLSEYKKKIGEEFEESQD